MSRLMLKPDWPGTFRRSVRDRAGNTKRRLAFEPGVPVELKGQELAAVQGDIGPALVEVELDQKGRPGLVAQPAAEEEAPAQEQTATQEEA